MGPRSKSNPYEVRARIIGAADDLFRRIGFQKTTVADIAKVLEMSSANVYRFFPSKSLINNAICERRLDKIKALLSDIVDSQGSAAKRIESAILAMHQGHKAFFTEDRHVHDMLRTAVEENWAAVVKYNQDCAKLLGRLISEGVAAGEFASCNEDETGATLLNICACVLHPSLLSICSPDSLAEDACRLIAFGLRALRAPVLEPAPTHALESFQRTHTRNDDNSVVQNPRADGVEEEGHSLDLLTSRDCIGSPDRGHPNGSAR